MKRNPNHLNLAMLTHASGTQEPPTDTAVIMRRMRDKKSLQDSLDAQLANYIAMQNSLPVLKRSIDILKLPTRPANSLNKKRIVTIGDLVNMSADDLFNLPNMGDLSVKNIIEKLAEHGLELRPRAASMQ